MKGARIGVRSVGAWGSALLCGVLALGCGEEEPPPVTAARQFVQAVQAGDVQAVLGMLDQEAVAHVQRAADRASDQVGGRRAIEPQEMLQVVDVEPNFQIKGAELVQSDGNHALVRLTGADDTSRVVDLVNESGSWRVNLPLPRATPMEDGIDDGMNEGVEP